VISIPAFLKSVPVVVLLGVLLAGAPGRAAETTLRIGGTGASVAVMTHLAGAFNRQQGEVKVEVLPSLGSSGGIRALADGAVELAVSARPLKPEEAAHSLVAAPLLRTPFTFVTSQREVQPIRSNELPRLYGDPDTRWDDGTPVRIVLRPASDSDSAYLVDNFPGMGEALSHARARPEVPVARTDQDNIRMARRVSGSLTTATLLQIVSEFADVTALPLDGVEPTVANMQSGRYPHYKEMIIVRRADSGETVTRFMEFLASESGRRLLLESGALPLL
jgi:phosphate transport system substrate-binding protein